MTFAMVPDAAWPSSDQWPWSTTPATGRVGWLGRPSVSDPWGVGSFLSLDRPTCVRCPGPLGSCSPVCPLGALRCVCGVQGHLAPLHRCARVAGRVACAVSWATFLPFTGAPARCVVLCVGCPRSLGLCSPVCPLGVLLCVCGVLGHLAPVHRCAHSVRCLACAVSWATWLLFTGVLAWFVVLRVRCPGPLGSCFLEHGGYPPKSFPIAANGPRFCPTYTYLHAHRSGLGVFTTLGYQWLGIFNMA